MIRLDAITGSPRVARLDQLDAYFQGRQYDGLRYDWDGRFGQAADIAPGWFVPYSQRRPRLNLELARRAVTRFTAMLFGEGHFPAIVIEDDEEASDWVNELAREASLAVRMHECRNKGGAAGSVGMSFAFIEGLPRLEIHRAKHLWVEAWADRAKLRPRSALKVWREERQIVANGKIVKRWFYFARRWTEQTETVWDPIPEDVAKTETWDTVIPSVTVEHGFGFCPLYLVQNRPDSESEDGESDYAGFDDDMDEVNRLVSATSKGTIANVDPTLVIKADPSLNQGVLRKGTDNAIFSPGGAEYLELTGASVTTAVGLARDLVGWMDESMGLVVATPEQLSGAARSAAALRMLYAPMTAQVSILREQYGALIVAVLEGMLRASRMIIARPPGPVVVTAEGVLVQHQPTVMLQPRLEDGKPVARTPGASSRITLSWPAFFEPTPSDASSLVDSAIKAKGVLISDRTAVRATAPLFGVTDVEEELEAIEEENAERQQQLGAGPDALSLDLSAARGDSTDAGEDRSQRVNGAVMSDEE